ncbi:UNVERIFIED_CONTAM: patatin, partial [Prevotella sp. 15_C9]
LVGGIFAIGKLNELKQRILNLNRKKIIGLMDIKPGLDHLATGNRLSEFLHDFTSDVRIENLPLTFCCCASDLVSGREKVFTTGSLLTAIRSSFSIPCFFSPIHE